MLERKIPMKLLQAAGHVPDSAIGDLSSVGLKNRREFAHRTAREYLVGRVKLG